MYLQVNTQTLSPHGIIYLFNLCLHGLKLGDLMIKFTILFLKLLFFTYLFVFQGKYERNTVTE